LLNNKKLFLQDISTRLGAIPAKESLLAALGFKTSRLGVAPHLYPSIIKLFKKYNY
jgi:hypothetical protein